MTTQTRNQKNRQALISIFFIFFFFIIFMTALVNSSFLTGLVAFDRVYSTGERIGQIVKISNKGYIWKTWEGAMGITQSGAYIDYWDFSIDASDPNGAILLKQLQEAVDSGAIVKITYDEHIGKLPWRGKTSYLIQSITLVSEPMLNTDGSRRR